MDKIIKLIRKAIIKHELKKNNYEYFTITSGKSKLVVIDKKAYTISL